MDIGIADSPLNTAYQREAPQKAIRKLDEHASVKVGIVFRALSSCLDIDPIILRWKIIDSIQRTLPFTRELPSDAVLMISFFIILVLIGAFLAFFLIGYMNGLNTTYLSPYDVTNYNSSSTSKYCHQVLTTNTGSYLATSTGQWQSDANFQYSNASYQAMVTSLSIAYDEYSFLMELIYEAILKLGQQAAHNSLTYNLIYWMTAVFVIPGTTTQRFYLTGSPITVFNRQHIGGVMSSVLGICSSKNVSSTTSYDSNSGIIQLTYSYEQYMENSLCLSAGDPMKLGYIPAISTDDFILKFDVRSLISAIAVNIGVITAAELVAISGFEADIPYAGHIFTVSTYYNPKFPSMTPMVCIRGSKTAFTNSSNDSFQNYSTSIGSSSNLDDDNSDGQKLFLCGLGFGNTYAVPIFNHFGANETYPVACDCSNSENLNLGSPFANCNKFNLISGVFYWNTSDPIPILELLTRYDFNYTQLNAAAFQASFIDSYWGIVSPYSRTLFQSPEYRAQSYAFCNSTIYGLCSMAIFSSFDDDFQANWAISEYYYILSNGACRDSITPKKDDWLKLVNYPFAPLVESYQKCSYSHSVLFLNQAGIAMGNASLLAPVGALLVIFVYHVLRWWCGASKQWSVPPYSRVEIERANNTLGIALLLARDNKLPGNTAIAFDDQEIMRDVVKSLSNEGNIVKDPKIMSIVKQLHAELACISAEHEKNSHKANGDFIPQTETVSSPITHIDGSQEI